MSWDRWEYTEYATCACGKGQVVRKAYREDDDWNRSRSGIISEAIQCPKCEKEYHIEHYVKYTLSPKWEDDGIIDKTYLIPNKMTLSHNVRTKEFNFSLDEEIVAIFSLNDIENAKNDMVKNKFSTRLELSCSAHIVAMYYGRYKKKSLPPIVELLSKIEKNYSQYKWHYKKYCEYRTKEQTEIKENEKIIQDVIHHSILLNFGERKHDQP